MRRVLVIGASGQIGSELVDALVDAHGAANVVAADLRAAATPSAVQFVTLDTLDGAMLREVVAQHRIDHVYQLAALLSAAGEAVPLKTWTLNVNALLNVLELAREGRVTRVFWPSSIAAFGPHSRRDDTPQATVMDPGTMYGITKVAGERLCEYYFRRFGVDVRSIRYPGVLGSRTPPGGGTTDYAIEMFQAAKRGEPYRCFLGPDTRLPMIGMPDVLRATVELMEADAARLGVHSSYNLAASSFTPAELHAAILRFAPGFEVTYAPDFRQAIADSWPRSIDDGEARRDWGWRPRFDFDRLVAHMWASIPRDWPVPGSGS
jgi:nucleoside-diphosphate-sugar epimerase